MKNLKVALIQDYLVQYGGAEKTLESWINIFPQAEIFTSLYNKQNMSDKINGQKIHTIKDTFFGKLPVIWRFPKYFTFLMPWVFESFDLSEFDLVISSGTAWPKGVLTTPDQMHIAYVHTPPRFLYGYSVESTKRNKWYFKPAVMVVDHFLRMWDFAAAQRPDLLIANSKETQSRITKFYRRESTVIYPPVEIEQTPTTNIRKEFKNLNNYYLTLGRLAAYKNVDLLIQAVNNTQLKLVVAGSGPEEPRLKKMAQQNTFFAGKVTEAEKSYLLENCLGVIFPVKEEDFGIVPVEAMAQGKPVLSHNSGGPKETVIEGKTGMLFTDLNPEKIREKMLEFDNSIKSGKFDPTVIKETTTKFSRVRFENEAKEFVETALKNLH